MGDLQRYYDMDVELVNTWNDWVYSCDYSKFTFRRDVISVQKKIIEEIKKMDACQSGSRIIERCKIWCEEASYLIDEPYK
jgi:hypothetical protein